jgi:ankyrin repeat protein
MSFLEKFTKKKTTFSYDDLYNAIEIGDITFVNKIICVNPNLMYEKDKYGFTVLHAVASTDNEEIANIILNLEMDINMRNEGGITALHTALYPNIAQMLIRHGADVNATDYNGNTPLHIKASDGEESFDVIEVLLNNGADKERTNKFNEKPYDIAKAREDEDNMTILK